MKKFFFILILIFSTVFASVGQSILFVDSDATGTGNGTSWTNAFTSIDSAFYYYKSGDSIWVKEGIYKPSGNSSSSFIPPNGVQLFGGFTGKESNFKDRPIDNFSILDGDIGTPNYANDNCKAVIRVSNNSSTIMINGFKIINGYANTSAGSTITIGGGAVRIDNGKVNFENCEFSDNYTYMRGGAIAIYGTSSTVRLLNCVVKNNVSNSSTSNALGGGIFVNAGNLYLTKCDFYNNTARRGGAISSFQPNINIDRCKFHGNSATNDYGGAIDNGSESMLTIYNSIFAGNYAKTSGAAIYTSTSLNTNVITYTNCTFTNNKNNSSSTNYAVYSSDYTIITNCIFYDNESTKPIFYLYPSITPLVRNCLFDGDTLQGATNCKYADPEFIMPCNQSAPCLMDSCNYMLKSTSVCVNSGNNSYLSSYLLDLSDLPRVKGGTVDIGAFESPFIHYDIQVLLNNDNAGRVWGNGKYIADSTVILRAVPSGSCYHFLGWYSTDSLISSDTLFKFAATSDSTIIAKFSQDSFTVFLSSNPINSGIVSGSGIYACNPDSVRTFTATPESCYTFKCWTLGKDTIGLNNPLVIAVNSDINIVANFVKSEYLIKTNANIPSAGYVIGGGVHLCDSTVKLVAHLSDTCYKFDSWFDSDLNQVVGTEDTLNLLASKNRNIVARFSIKNYNIIVNVKPNIGGTVTGTGMVGCGNQVTLVATPEKEYKFVSWEENNNVISSSNIYKFKSYENRTIVANFELTVGLSEDVIQGYKIYPNPTKNIIIIETDSKTNMKIILFSAVGEELMNYDNSIGESKIELNLENLPDGLYYLRTLDENHSLTVKVQIIH
ncbi:MAG: T9SS type A sorting domain-containing protein [Flavobacteriales bacterium]|nr:T9SS type A sorting domain-containing protein [Flavobacteriales bacterium]